MADDQPSLLCAPLGLPLLLLTGVISFYLPEVHARPSNFWCNIQDRKSMNRGIEELRMEMDACVGSDELSSPVQLPCVRVQPIEWANKSLQQKIAEVVGAIRVFQDGVNGVNRTTLQCQTSLLEKLGQHIAKYLATINRLQKQCGMVTPSQSTVQNCSSQTSLKEVLKEFKKLLNGKMWRLAVDLPDSTCQVACTNVANLRNGK